MLKKALVLLAALFVANSSPGYAQGQGQTGTVRVKVVRVGLVVGGGGGNGTLTYRGKVYPFTVGGLGMGSIGATSADLTGRAYNLRRPSDIVGAYTSVGAGVTLAGGVKAVRLQNSNGVVLELRGVQRGLEVAASVTGMTITMQ
jgi:hypothetical protein